MIVTSYRRPGQACAAVASALAQEAVSLEVIVVEDGSRTDLFALLEPLRDPRVRFLSHRLNFGLAAARNTGAAAARGKWLSFLDDDDCWHAEKLSRQLNLASRHSPGTVIYCAAKTVDANNRLLARQSPTVFGDIRQSVIRGKLTTVPSSLLIERELFNQIGGFDEDLITGIDHDFWFKLASKGLQAEALNQPLVIQRECGGGRMTTDLQVRLSGVDAFLRKWQPDLVAWMGTGGARKFMRDYRSYYLCHSCVAGLGNHGAPARRIRLLREFIGNPRCFFRHPRFAVALFLGAGAYRYLRRVRAGKTIS